MIRTVMSLKTERGFVITVRKAGFVGIFRKTGFVGTVRKAGFAGTDSKLAFSLTSRKINLLQLVFILKIYMGLSVKL